MDRLNRPGAARVSALVSPIVFVHGFLGFAYIPLGLHRVYYFRRLNGMLRQQGLEVYFPRLPPWGTVAQRARALADYLTRIPGGTLHLVGHSMGGLDCRYLIHYLDPGHRVRTLTTIGTPHRGSPVARWALDTRGPVQWMGRRWWRDALHDLVPETCARFNEEIPDRAGVSYASYAGVRPEEEMAPWFRPWTRLMEGLGEENDSQVPISSARWGTFHEIQRADHLELVGWNLALPRQRIGRPFDHMGFYRKIVADLAAGTVG